MSSSSPSLPNLLDCNPEDLAAFLLNERFNTNTKDTASFLLRAISSLPNAEELSAGLLLLENNNEEPKKVEEINMNELLMPPVKLSMIQPSRGEFASIVEIVIRENDDILGNILSFLDVIELSQKKPVCKQWKNLCKIVIDRKL
eukprot:CAMPEP_0194171132 /NCGR_PEP_ID=MMETSP0154-20130528/5743_1 /TAXON_ID=1049557 /ORGANISM="Thalassiothrix antarctica, Strain L6-D1" /LENGTH=143 /DNA_ID=CAMNT_0038883291 /DNA_START=108 /DNA_END=535 /DNA_ORIENTATION=+